MVEKVRRHDSGSKGGGPAKDQVKDQASILGKAFSAAYRGDLRDLSLMIDAGFPVDTKDPNTGMSLLHIAVGRNYLEMTRFLVERGGSFFPDAQGRWPTTIAAICEVSEELSDYIAEAEAKAESV